MDTLVPTNRARSAIVSFLGAPAAAADDADADPPPPEPQLHVPRRATSTNATDVRMRGGLLAARRRSDTDAPRRRGTAAAGGGGRGGDINDDDDDDTPMADGAASRTRLLGVRGGRVGKDGRLPRGRSSKTQKAREAARIAAGDAAADAAPMEVAAGTPDERLAAAVLAAKRQRRKATRTRSRQKNLRRDTRRGRDVPAHLSAGTLAGGRLAPGEPIFRPGVLDEAEA